MYSQISQVLAQEHARDLQSAADRASRRRQARSAQRALRAELARRSARQADSLATAPDGLATAPDSYEDFLSQTAGSVVREPTATGRSGGQAVR